MTIQSPLVVESEKLAGALAGWAVIYTATDDDYSDSIIIRNTLTTRIRLRYNEDDADGKYITVNAGEKFVIDGIKFYKQRGRIIEAIIDTEVPESLRINLV